MKIPRCSAKPFTSVHGFGFGEAYEGAKLNEFGATAIAFEEAEVAVALAQMFLREIGASEEEVNRQTWRIRQEQGLPLGRFIPKAGSGPGELSTLLARIEATAYL